MIRGTMKDEATINELKRIASLNGGVLLAEDVVRYAKEPTSILHEHFTWEDGEAASLWRLHEARNLIRVTVAYIGESKEPVRVFVSMKADREESGGGYRSMVSVLSDDEMREQFLREALEEMKVFRDKYKSLKELSEVFAAMEHAETQLVKEVSAAG